MVQIRVNRLEEHYTIKIVDKLPKKGNANWLYSIIEDKNNSSNLNKFLKLGYIF